MGGISAGIGISVQVNSADTVDDLEGVSTSIGFTAGAPLFAGIDVVSNANITAEDSDINGVQISAGVGAGVDVHVSQSKTATLVKTNWVELGNRILDLFR